MFFPGMISPSPGNLTLVIPRTLLDKLDSNGNDDAFGVIANRAVGFEETSTTPTSRTLVVQFEPGVNYIQILGTKSLESNQPETLLSKSQFTDTSVNTIPESTNLPEKVSQSRVTVTPTHPNSLESQSNPLQNIPNISSQSDNATSTEEKQVSVDSSSPTLHGKSYFEEVFESEPADPVYVLSHSTKKDDIDGPVYKLVGEIKNNSSGPAKFVKIIGTFYDKDGIVIGTDLTYTKPHDIQPGRTAPYEFTIGFGDSIPVNDIAKAKSVSFLANAGSLTRRGCAIANWSFLSNCSRINGESLVITSPKRMRIWRYGKIPEFLHSLLQKTTYSSGSSS